MKKNWVLRAVCFLAVSAVVCGPASAEKLSFREYYTQAEEMLLRGDVSGAETAWTELKNRLESGRAGQEETVLLADTEYALAGIAGLSGNYCAAYDGYSSAYIWYRGLLGDQDRRTADARLQLIRLQAERLEMEEQALREAESLMSSGAPGFLKEIAAVLSFEVRLRMNSRQETKAMLETLRAMAAAPDGAPDRPETEDGFLPGSFRPGDQHLLSCLALSDYFVSMNQPAEALNYAEEALKAAGEADRAENRISALMRAGFVRMYFYGETEDNQWISQGVSLAEKAWREGPALANIYALAGETCYSAGSYGPYYDYLSKALAMAEKTAGENHPLTADICLLLSPWYRLQGDYRTALDLCERSVRIQLSFLKDGTAMLGSSYNHLAHCLADVGDSRGAAEALEKSIDIYRALGDGLQAAVAERNLALILNNGLGLHEEALAHLRNALELAERQPRNVHPETLAAIYMLAADILTPEDAEYGSIETWAEEARQCLELAAVNTDEYMANYHELLGRYLMENGRAEEALEHLMDTRALFEAVYGEESSYPVNVFYDIADCLRRLRDSAAADWYARAVSWAEERMAFLSAQGIEDLAYPMSTRDNALHYLREWENRGGSW